MKDDFFELEELIGALQGCVNTGRDDNHIAVSLLCLALEIKKLKENDKKD